MRPIGYYVHHHGIGHRQRALAVAKVCSNEVTLLGTGLDDLASNLSVVSLPDDRMSAAANFDGNDGEADRPEVLHYAPLNHHNVRERMAIIAGWIARKKPALIVVDVSVEVSLLARLCATPVAYVRLSGRRNDIAHLQAYRGASLIIAPFAEKLDNPDVPDWVRKKTIYIPGVIRRFAQTIPTSDSILIVQGQGGSSLSVEQLVELACASPNDDFRVIGFDHRDARLPANLNCVKWSDEPEFEIARAKLVIGSAGDGLVSMILAAARPFICLPQDRPFDEQVLKARALQDVGAAIVVPTWPKAGEWNNLLRLARAIDPANQRRLDDPNGLMRFAEVLTAFAKNQK